MQIISENDKINSLIEEGKVLKQRSININNIKPSEINELYLQEGRNLLREIGTFVSGLSYRESKMQMSADMAEADQVRKDKINKLQDIVIRSSKNTYGHGQLVKVIEFNYIKSILLTEIKLLNGRIELATMELGRQARII